MCNNNSCGCGSQNLGLFGFQNRGGCENWIWIIIIIIILLGGCGGGFGGGCCK